jgi:hypothetical protein
VCNFCCAKWFSCSSAVTFSAYSFKCFQKTFACSWSTRPRGGVLPGSAMRRRCQILLSVLLSAPSGKDTGMVMARKAWTMKGQDRAWKTGDSRSLQRTTTDFIQFCFCFFFCVLCQLSIPLSSYQRFNSNKCSFISPFCSRLFSALFMPPFFFTWSNVPSFKNAETLVAPTPRPLISPGECSAFL